MTSEDCVAGHVMSADMAAYLSAAVRSRLNILICGGTGAGKTTLLNMLRSEEHTSELQSLMRISYAVFCLKKKTRSNRSQRILARSNIQNRSRCGHKNVDTNTLITLH